MTLTNPYQPPRPTPDSSDPGTITGEGIIDQERNSTGEWLGWSLLSVASFISGGVASNFEFRNVAAFVMFLCGVLAAIMALLAQSQRAKQPRG